MPADSGATGGAPFTVERETGDGGQPLVRLSGRVEFPQAGALARALTEAVHRDDQGLRLDLSGLELLDGGCAAILYGLRKRQFECGAPVEFAGATDDVAEILELYDDHECQGTLREAPSSSAFEQIGAATLEFAGGVQGILDFLGQVTLAVLRAPFKPSTINWRDLGRLMEKVGADALPIVVLIAFLIGLVMAFQSAGTLASYGANVFLADMVGLSMTRLMGPLMMAILVAGRSGAGISAELGTMKVSEEIDALRTLGLDPIGFLVIPRVLALVLMVPFLTLLADLVGIIGGGIIGVTLLELTPDSFVNRLTEALSLWDVGTGVILSIAYGIAIGLIACERGLATSGGAEGVGRFTTAAVVTILFHLVIITSVLTSLFMFWDI